MTQARILRQAPILYASNLRDTIAYWRDKLGFEVHGTFGEPPVFGIMEYDNAFVMLKQAPAGHAIVPYWRITEGTWNAYFWVDDVDALFAEVKRRGVTIDYGLCDQFYGVREFAVRDPGRQSIGFGQVLAQASGGQP